MPAFIEALNVVLQPTSLLFVVLGVLGGIIIGGLPGLSATMGVAILVPMTYTLDPTSGIMLLLGIYIGAIYGGSVAAILLKIPGTPAAVVTSFDGYSMGQKGEAGRAIGIATCSSVVGGLISVLFLIFMAPIISSFALSFGGAEYFALALFGLTIIINVSGTNLAKGVIATLLGLMVAMVGIDDITSQSRFTFDSIYLITGISFIPIMVGLFGFSEVLHQLERIGKKVQVKQKIKNIVPKMKEIKDLAPVWLRGSIIGSFIGALPGAGAPVAAFVSYDIQKRLSKKKKEFGKGCSEGIAAPESANNATTGGALVPLMSLGIPGDAVTAILVGAFMIHNIRPGPTLFINNPEIVYSIFLALFFANIALLILGLAGARLYAKVLSVPIKVLLPTVVMLCIIGAYATNNTIFDVWIMMLFGVIGYFMIKVKIPITPMVLGIVLGPILEKNFREALKSSQGDYTVFFSSWISASLIILAILVVILSLVSKNSKLKEMES